LLSQAVDIAASAVSGSVAQSGEIRTITADEVRQLRGWEGVARGSRRTHALYHRSLLCEKRGDMERKENQLAADDLVGWMYQ
jgi:hypothetical protein